MLDEWDGEENSSNVEIKKEKDDPDETMRSKSREVKDPRKSSRERSRGRSNRSRSRSRERNRGRIRSPIHRRRSPPRQKTSFLEELKEELAKQGKDTNFIDEAEINTNPRSIRPERNNFRMNRHQIKQRMEQQQHQQFMREQQQQQNMMNNFNYNFMQNMPYQQFNPMCPQISYDMYGNPIQQIPQMMMPVPQPVPPPLMNVNVVDEFSNPGPSQNDSNLEVVKPKSNAANTLKKVKIQVKFILKINFDCF